MSRSYKHNPGYCCYTSNNHRVKPLAARCARHTALDTIGYLSDEDGDPLIGKAKRSFTRAYRSREIHDGEFLRFREYAEREYREMELQGFEGWDEQWKDVPYKRCMYRLWAKSCHCK